MSTIIFTTTEISGLTNPTYPSAAARKKYVDDISSNCINKYAPSSLTSQRYTEYIGHSSNTLIHYTKESISLSDLSDVTISVPVSGESLVWDGTLWRATLVSGQGGVGVGGTSNYTSGWAYISSESKITHGFGAVPTIVGLFPSGDASFGCSAKVDGTFITAYLSISGLHCVNWFAGGPTLSETALTALLDDNYTGSSNVNRALIDTISGNLDSRIDALGGFDPIDYIISTTAITRFADSSNYSSHKGNTIIHFTKTSIDDDYQGSSQAIIKFAGSSQINRGLLNLISSNLDLKIDSLFNWSSNKGIYAPSSLIKGYYYPSSLGKSLMNFSSNKSLYPASSLVNRALINTISSNIDTRLDSIFNYSSNARNLYADSGNVKYRFVASSISLSRYNQYVGHSG
ncbi:MAG: hypothetical protein IMZ59_05170, partial [Actinobacteria bacterium]|nr:hypothetical protein [Actinomycetota bacterium]